MAGFRKATKKAKNLVISLQGASGAGKTYSALNVAKYLCPPGKRIAFVDTENSADLYGDIFDFDVDNDFGPFGKLNYSPDEWMKKLRAAAEAKQYGVVVLDSLTHMWKGQGGILWQLDQEAAAYKAKTSKFADTNALWKKFDPMYTRFMNDLRHLPFHVLFCLRAKQKTERKTNDKSGKMEISKLGLEPEFRDGFDYDVDAQFLIDEDHVLVAKKHRLGDHLNGKVFENPGKNLADVLADWLVNGVDTSVEPEAGPSVAKAAPQPTEEEVAPVTRPEPELEQPAAPTAAPSIVSVEANASLFLSLKARIQKAVSAEELKEVSTKVTAGRKEGFISDAERNELAAAFNAQSKLLKEKAA